MDARLRVLVQQAAQRYNLDPRAMLAIAHHESGDRFGAVGDNGSSFGPWQLHVGGALPQGMGANFANSRKGVMYVARQMAADGAAGKKGLAAIQAMSRNFERPANPAAEIQDAWNFYQGHPGMGAGGIGGGAGGGMMAVPHAGLTPNKAAIAQSLMNFATTGSVTGTPGANPVVSMFSNYMQQHGTLNTPVSSKTGAFPGATGKVAGILQSAHSVVGTPYVWGGESKKGFDCSGLIQWAYAQHGINLPRTTYQQIKVGKPVQWGKFRPGDLIFSNFEGPGAGPTHVVMYVGNGKVIAAPHTGASVEYENVNLFKNNFVGARRVV